MDAARWIGYLEHKSPHLLGYFAENTGKKGYTIFGAATHLNGLPWCVTFIHAVVNRPDILGKPCAGCKTLQRRMKRKGLWRGPEYKPKPGDVIFCSNRRTAYADHCGIVENCTNETVISIDGNTVDPSGHFSPHEGGAVARRVRQRTDPMIVGYGAISERM